MKKWWWLFFLLLFSIGGLLLFYLQKQNSFNDEADLNWSFNSVNERWEKVKPVPQINFEDLDALKISPNPTVYCAASTFIDPLSGKTTNL